MNFEKHFKPRIVRATGKAVDMRNGEIVSFEFPMTAPGRIFDGRADDYLMREEIQKVLNPLGYKVTEAYGVEITNYRIVTEE